MTEFSHKDLLISFLDNLRTWSQESIHKYQEEIDSLLNELAIDKDQLKKSDTELFLKTILSLRRKSERGSEDFAKYSAIHSAWMAMADIHRFESGDLHFNESDDFDKLLTVYLLGAADGSREVADPSVVTRLRKAREELNKQAATSRWASYHKLMDRACGVAKKLWEEGDRRFHNEMADYLLSLQEFNELHGRKPAILRRLKEIAKEKGRIKGVKGNKR
jgi:hypothetical protein